MVKPEGRIVYSVCTLTLQECEQNARYAEATCNLSIEEQAPMLGERAIGVVESHTERCQRFHPHRNGAGYFIAAFQKRSL
jgi:16S rRNA C967 or C1407 C5-methylase (RsmB/RsmF family)